MTGGSSGDEPGRGGVSGGYGRDPRYPPPVPGERDDPGEDGIAGHGPGNLSDLWREADPWAADARRGLEAWQDGDAPGHSDQGWYGDEPGDSGQGWYRDEPRSGIGPGTGISPGPGTGGVTRMAGAAATGTATVRAQATAGRKAPAARAVAAGITTPGPAAPADQAGRGRRRLTRTRSPGVAGTGDRARQDASRTRRPNGSAIPVRGTTPRNGPVNRG